MSAINSSSRKSSDGLQLRERIKFIGQFTDVIRIAFCRKRLQLGLSYHQLAEFFGLHWSTVRKWEVGPTICCERVYRAKIEGFINGDYDKDLQEKAEYEQTGYEMPMPETVYQCFERIAGVCTLCNGDQEIIRDLVDQVDEVTRRALSDLIAKELVDPSSFPPLLP